MNELYVSGSLRRKSINFYRDSILGYDEKGFVTSEVTLLNNGKLVFLPWDEAKKSTLCARQQNIMTNLSEEIKANIINKTLLKRLNESAREIINIIFLNTNRNISFALLECLRSILMSSADNKTLLKKINEFKELITYLISFDTEIKQGDLNIILYLFLNNETYSPDDILKYKENTFRLSYNDLDSHVWNLVLFGEEIAPERIKHISKDLMSNPFESTLVAPIYFALKDEKKAFEFLKFCRGIELDKEKIEKNAKLCRIPNNMINLVR